MRGWLSGLLVGALPNNLELGLYESYNRHKYNQNSINVSRSMTTSSKQILEAVARVDLSNKEGP